MSGQDEPKNTNKIPTSVKASVLHTVVSNREEHLIKLSSIILEILKSSNNFKLQIGPQVDDVAMEDYKFIENLSFEFLGELKIKGLITDLDNTVETDFETGLSRNVVYAKFKTKNNLELKQYLIEYISKKDLDKKMSFLSYENGILTIKNKEIKILSQSESNADRLLSLMFTDKTNEWHRDEILEEWGYSVNDDSPKQLIYQTGLDVNRKVKKQAGISNFLNVTTKKVSINRDF